MTERDRDIIRLAYECRFLNRSILRLFFPPERSPAIVPPKGATRLDKRLAALYHHGYLDRTRLVTGGELIYAVGTYGLHLLMHDQNKLSIKRIPRTKLWPYYIEHCLMIARLRASIEFAIRSHPNLTLEHFERESINLKARWREPGDEHDTYVNPDAFFVLRDSSLPKGQQRYAFFLEADRGTMPILRHSTGSSYAPKLLRYCRMHELRHESQFTFDHQGVSTPIRAFAVLTVTPDAHRIVKLFNFAARSDLIRDEYRILFYFTTEELFTADPRRILDQIWLNATDRQRPPKPITFFQSPLDPEKAA